MRISKISSGASCFLDANIFIYHLAGASKHCTTLLERMEQGDVKGVTSLRVLEETLHRRLIAEATSQFQWAPGQVMKRLKANPEKVKAVTKHWDDIENILNVGIEIYEYTVQDLIMSRTLQKKYGLLISDSLTLRLMEKHSVGILASRDEDFLKADFINLWIPELDS